MVVALICFAATNSMLDEPAPGTRHAGVILLISLALCAPLVVRTYLPLTAWSASAVAMFLVGGAVSA